VVIETVRNPQPLSGSFGRYTSPLPKPRGSVMGAGFRLENDIVNAINWLSRPIFQFDPDFDFKAHADVSDMFKINPEAFIGTRNSEDWFFREVALAQELQDRQIIHQAGAAGIGAAMLAGVLSPTVLLPIGGAARAATVMAGSARAAVWTVGAVSIQEAILQTNQEFRTGAETAIGISTAAVIGGILGGAVRYLDPLGMDGIAKNIAADINSGGRTYQAPITPSAVGGRWSLRGLDGRFITVEELKRIEGNFRVKADPDKPLFIDTRGTGVRFHGSKEPITSLAPDSYTSRNFYGQGFYSTDAAAVGKGYAKGDTGILYKVIEKTKIKAFNLEKVIPKWLITALKDDDIALDALSFENAVGEPIVKTTRDLFDELRNTQLVSADEIQETMSLITNAIEKQGFNALDHVGGSRTKTAPHAVRIYLDPEKTIKITEVSEDKILLEFAGDRSIGAALTPQEVLDEFQPSFIEHDALGLAPSGGLAKLLRPTNPGLRLASSEHQPVRLFQSQMDSLGLYYNVNFQGGVTAPGGDIISRVAVWDGTMIEAIMEQQRLFTKAYFKAKKGGAFRAFFAFGESKQFSREITLGLHLKARGLTHEIPEVVQAGAAYQKHFEALLRRAIELKMKGFEDVPLEGAFRRALQHVRAEHSVEHWNKFNEVINENAVEVLRRTSQGLTRAQAIKRLELDDHDLAITGKDGKPLHDFDEMSNDLLSDQEIASWAFQITDKVSARLTRSMQRHGTVTAMIKMPKNAWEFYYIDPVKTWSNGMTFGEFLEQDIEKIARSFTRTMAAHIEMQRVWGVVNPTKLEAKGIPLWSRIEASFRTAKEEASEAGDKKLLAKIVAEERQVEIDIETQAGRILHTWGQPADPMSIGSRLGRGALQVSTIRLMGGVTFASVPDLGRPILKLGFMNTYDHGLKPLMASMVGGDKTFKIRSKQSILWGANTDVYQHGRLQAMSDLMNDFEFGNRLERGLQYMTSKMGLVALFDYWNQMIKGFTANVLMGTMIEAIDAIVEGSSTKWQRTLLASLNLSQDDIFAIYKAMRTPDGGTEIQPNIFLPNSESWSIELAHRFKAAIVRGVKDTIVTPGLERPSWTDGTQAGQIIAQFRSFTFSSTLKVGLAGAQDLRAGNMGQIMAGVPFSLALGLFSYYIWASAFGPGSGPREKMLNEFRAALDGDLQALGRLADESIDRSGLIGLLTEATRFAERVPSLAPFVRFGDVPSARSPHIDPLLDLFGPTVGLLKNASAVLTSIHDPTSMTFNKGKTLLPYQNVFYLRWGLDQVRDAAKRQLGINN